MNNWFIVFLLAAILGGGLSVHQNPQTVDDIKDMFAPSGKPTPAPEESALTSAVETTPPPPAPTQGWHCGQLDAGCQAVVINTYNVGLNIRSAPDINGAIIGRLSDGDIVFVVDGPVQSDGYRWWQFSAGWVADGETDKDGRTTRWLKQRATVPYYNGPYEGDPCPNEYEREWAPGLFTCGNSPGPGYLSDCPNPQENYILASDSGVSCLPAWTAEDEAQYRSDMEHCVAIRDQWAAEHAGQNAWNC